MLRPEKQGFEFVMIRNERHRRRLLILVLLCVGLAMVSACRGEREDEEENWLPSDPSVRRVTDDLGRAVTLPAKVSRIVSLAPSLTESIFAAGGGDRLVGVTSFCNYPEAAKSIAKVGDTINPNIETIIALKPDVVFVSKASQIEAFTKTLADNRISVFVSDPIGLNGVFREMRIMGEIFGTADAAEQRIAELQARVAKVEMSVKDAQRPKVFVQISIEPLFTIGKQSFLNDVIYTAGGASATADVDTAYPKLSKETAVALQPDVIILSDSEDNREPNAVFAASPAVKGRRVYKIDADLISRPGPRLVDALEQIARSIHPERFR